MNKLYVGNLGTDVNEGTLHKVFEDHGIKYTNILVKKGGYAFVDCPDQTSADKAIDELNGFNLMGSSLLVEPSVPRRGRTRSTKVQVRNIPSHVNWDDLERLIATFGTVQRCEQVPGDMDHTTSVNVTYESQEQAQQAVAQLNEYEYEGSTLQVDYLTDRNSRNNRSRSVRSNPYSGMGGGTQRSTEFPLRIVVPSDMVGAIIGRQGGTIRSITQQTRARVDVHRKDNAGSLEKVQAITIYGQPENCTNACNKILEVMQQEAAATNKGEIPLKILAHNNLVGRIIGKNGATIKRIMQDTDTKITVSSIHDVNSFNLERTITIKGTPENMAKAEAQISAKLKQSYENDLAAMSPQSMMFPGLHPMAMMSTMGNYPRGPNPYGLFVNSEGTPNFLQGMYPPGMTPTPQMQQTTETVYLHIPNAAVGAVIGTKGSHIRNIIRLSGASVKIAPLNKDQDPSSVTERMVTIVGTPEAQWKAQFCIFEKIREEGFAGNDEVRLRVEIMVPISQVGRIIGKGGQNVRELQRVTGAIIKLPEESQQPQGDEVPVRIIGHFYATQSAQRRIRALICQNQPTNQVQPRRRGQRDQTN